METFNELLLGQGWIEAPLAEAVEALASTVKRDDLYEAALQVDQLLDRASQKAHRLAQLAYELAKHAWADDQDLCNRCAFALATTCRALGHYLQALELYRQCLDFYQATGQQQAARAARGNLGGLYLSLGHYDQARAELQALLADAEAAGDTNQVRLALATLGDVAMMCGDYRAALAHLDQVCMLSAQLGDADAPTHRNSRGLVLGHLGDYDRAMAELKRAESVFRQRGDLAGTGKALGNQGIIYQRQGDYRTAAQRFRDALELACQTGDRYNEAQQLSNLGICARITGDLPAAENYLREALVLSRAHGDRAGEANHLSNLAAVAQVRGRYEQALRDSAESLNISRAIGYGRGILLGLLGQGTLRGELGDMAGARVNLKEGLALCREAGERSLEALFLHNLGHILDEQDDEDAALALWQEALTVSQSLGDRENEAVHWNVLGGAWFQREDYAEAERCYRHTLACAEAAGDWRMQMSARHMLAAVQLRQGQVETARAVFKDVLDDALTSGLDGQAFNSLVNLGRLYWHELANPAAAYRCFVQASNLLKRMTQEIMLETHRSGLLVRREDVYVDLVLVCLQIGQSIRALEHVECSRSQALLAQLAHTPLRAIGYNRVKDDDWLDQIRSVHLALRSSREPGDMARYLTTLADLREQYRTWLEAKTIGQVSPEYAALRLGRPLSFDEISELLQTAG